MDYKSITTEELERMIRQMGQKDGEALCELGERYLYGQNGTMANPTKAGRLFEKAEKLGEKRAYAGLAEMYHKGIFFIKNEDIAREYYAKAGMRFPQNEPPQPETSEPSQYVSPGHQSAGSQITEMEILDLIRDAQNCREKEDYETAKRICGRKQAHGPWCWAACSRSRHGSSHFRRCRRNRCLRGYPDPSSRERRYSSCPCWKRRR